MADSFMSSTVLAKNSDGNLSTIKFRAVNKGRRPAKTAGYWPNFGRLLLSHFTVNFSKKLKIRKRPNKIIVRHPSKTSESK